MAANWSPFFLARELAEARILLVYFLP